MHLRPLLPLLSSLVLLACSSDPAAPELVRPSDGGAGGTAGTGSSGSPAVGGSSGSPASGGSSGSPTSAGAGGIDNGGKGTEVSYPQPEEGFGFEVNQIAPDKVFKGLVDPKAVNYSVDDANIAKIAFHDYYNPTDDPTKTRALVVTGAARWCAPCKEEASKSMPNYNYWKDKGVVFLVAIIEDENNQPSTFNDLKLWSDAYNLEYPTVLDPAPPQLGAFFPQSAVPFNMVIDTRTMKIVYKEAGAVSFDKNNPTLNKIAGG